MTDPHLIVEQFFDEADALRAAFDAHFSDSHQHTLEHQVWDYWYVPEVYTYLRTMPKKVIPETLLASFMQRLNGWAMAALGLCTRTPPWLSLYINGCSQGLHNDSRNGQMGYVYSITKWDGRTFLGGETVLFRPENYWETTRIKDAGGLNTFCETVPSRFNQLLVFDDRLIHGVRPVQGTMDPLAGRVVMHGHLSAGVAMVSGAVAAEPAYNALRPTMEQIKALVRQHEQLFHGFMTFRLAIETDGRVGAVRTLCDRVMPLSADKSRLDPLTQDIVGLLSGVIFPPAAGPSEFTLPVLIGS